MGRKTGRKRGGGRRWRGRGREVEEKDGEEEGEVEEKDGEEEEER